MFIGFGAADPNKAENNEDVRLATQHLIKEIIPHFALQLEREKFEITNLKEEMHRQGYPSYNILKEQRYQSQVYGNDSYAPSR